MNETTTEEWLEVPMNPEDGDKGEITSKEEVEEEVIEKYYNTVADAALARLENNPSPIFTVDLPRDALWKVFLEHLPRSMRQRFSCTTCRNFITRYGGLAQVNKAGNLQPLMWSPTDSPVPEHLRACTRVLHDKVTSASILDVFKVTTKTKSAGARNAGGYKHFYLDFPDARLHKEEPKGFASASVKDLADMLGRILEDFSLNTVRSAATILTEDKLPYAASHKNAIRWLLDLRDNDMIKRGSEERNRHNLLYLYAASAFMGCLNQLRSGALSVLLEDIETGKEFDEIKSHWLRICDPLHYLRPQAAPNTFHIAAAERLMQSLGVTANDMRRRQLTMSEVPKQVIMWAAKKRSTGRDTMPDGIFSKLKPRSPVPKAASAKKILDMPATRLSFTKLITDILPKAIKLEYKLGLRDGIFFCVTGLEGTTPLMQWHNDQNKASWFLYHNPYPVKHHNLLPNAWNEVACVIPFPHLWDGIPQTTTLPLIPEQSKEFKHYHKNRGFRYLLCLENVQLNDSKAHLCLFPSLLKSEFHGIRRTIEAYSNDNY